LNKGLSAKADKFKLSKSIVAVENKDIKASRFDTKGRMRIYKNSMVDTYRTDGKAFRIRWSYNDAKSSRSGRETYDVSLDYRNTRRGDWKEVYTSYGSMGNIRSGKGDKAFHSFLVSCVEYPGCDDDGHELPHPGAKFPGLLDALSMASYSFEEE